MNNQARSLLIRAPLVPVITIHNIEDAVPLARALQRGGIHLLEMTLRTPRALEAISRIRAEVEGAVVGAGTVLNRADLDNALAAGSEFVITPGATTDLLAAGGRCGVPFYPGVSTALEVMNCLEHNLDTLKFFPAEASGGVKKLKAFSGPFAQVCFCPTGGIGPHNLAEYLALDNVLSVGGSWMVPDELVTAGQWSAVSKLAAQACEQVANLQLAAEERS